MDTSSLDELLGMALQEALPQGTEKRVYLPVYGPTTGSGRLFVDYGKDCTIINSGWEGQYQRTYSIGRRFENKR